MPLTKVNGINLYYEQRGAGEDLLLICGFGSNLTRWKAADLGPLEQIYRITLFDNRGSGQTDAPPPPYTIETMAEDAVGLMEALSIPYAYILGHSMGSAIVQHLCIDHPSKVKKALLLNSFAHLSPTTSLQLDTTAKLFAAEVDIVLILETLLPWLFGSDYLSKPHNVKKALDDFLKDPYPQKPNGFAGQLAALKGFDTRKRLKEITTPTLIVAGALDLYTTPAYSQYLHATIPDSELHIIKGAGHTIPNEKPHELIQLMLNFFS